MIITTLRTSMTTISCPPSAYRNLSRQLLVIISLALFRLPQASSFLRSSARKSPYNLFSSTTRSCSYSHIIKNKESTIKMVTVDDALHTLQHIIGQDAGNRGMKDLIVPGDFSKACRALAMHHRSSPSSTVILLSGFPCCVTESPPTETDGPPGACAIAHAAIQLGNRVILVTDDCNKAVFEAAAQTLLSKHHDDGLFSIQTFPVDMDDADIKRMEVLWNMEHALLIAIERSGPSKDGNCYTMRGIDMRELTAPVHKIVLHRRAETIFIAIGDGGNELGMGKVIGKVRKHIPNGDKVGCVVEADLLIAASVSNWGGYALAAGSALVRAEHEATCKSEDSVKATQVKEWIDKCIPTEHDETELLGRCVKEGCRDGVTGKVEATVDGMPLETSLDCLGNIRTAACNVG